jgi:hypothetical protein
VSRQSNSTPHHPGISVASHSWPCFKLCGGNIRHEFFAHCSTTELRRLSPPAGIEPATHGSDVTCAFATPQTFQQNRACTHAFSTHTPALSCAGGALFTLSFKGRAPNAPTKSIHHNVNLFREEQPLTVFRASNPRPFGLTRSNCELHHPGKHKHLFP